MTDFTIPATYPGRNGDLELDVEIEGRITSPGLPAIGPSLSGPGEPAEPPEWQLTSIMVDVGGRFIPAESWFAAEDLDHLWSWAEDQVDGDHLAEAQRDEAAAEAEYRYEQRRDRLD